MTTKKILLLAAVALAALSFACKKDSGGPIEPPPPPTAAQLIAQGWTAFAAHNYAGAEAKFAAALALDGTLVDAYNGAGWSDAHLDSLAAAAAQFRAGRARAASNLDILAGLAFIHNATREYALSVNEADTLFQASPSGWTFSRDAALNTADLRIVMAEDYYAMGDFASSLSTVVLLNASFTADVATPVGRSALAAEIERLKSVNS